MKPNIPMLVLSLGAALLAGYGLYACNNGEENVLLLSIIGGICVYSTLAGAIGFYFERDGHSWNVRITSFLFLIAFSVDNIIFSFIGIYVAPYIIISGFLLLIYAGIMYALIKTNV